MKSNLASIIFIAILFSSSYSAFGQNIQSNYFEQSNGQNPAMWGEPELIQVNPASFHFLSGIRYSFEYSSPLSQLSESKTKKIETAFMLPLTEFTSSAISYRNFQISSFGKPLLQTHNLDISVARNFGVNLIGGLQFGMIRKSWSVYDFESDFTVSSIHSDNSFLKAGIIYLLDGNHQVGISAQIPVSGNINSETQTNLRVGYTFSESELNLSLFGSIEKDVVFNDYVKTISLSSVYSPFELISLMGCVSYKQYSGYFFNTGIQFSLNRESNSLKTGYAIGVYSPSDVTNHSQSYGASFQTETDPFDAKQISPDLFLNDKSNPLLSCRLLSVSTIQGSIEHPDSLKIYYQVKDDYSGIDELVFSVYQDDNLSVPVIMESKKFDSEKISSGVIRFPFQGNSENILPNGYYVFQISARDKSGKKSNSDKIQFRILSPLNDKEPPQVSFMFADTLLTVSESSVSKQIPFSITATDNQSKNIKWVGELYSINQNESAQLESRQNGISTGNKTNSFFTFSSSINSINQVSKLFAIIYTIDEVGNKSQDTSSAIPVVYAIKQLPVLPIFTFQEPKKILLKKQDQKIIPATPVTKAELFESNLISDDHLISLSPFSFHNGQLLVKESQNGLNLLGVLLQDFPDKQLTAEIPILNHESNSLAIINFLKSNYLIEENRIKFTTASANKLNFIIK